MNIINHVKANIFQTNGKGTVLMSEIKRQRSEDTPDGMKDVGAAKLRLAERLG